MLSDCEFGVAEATRPEAFPCYVGVATVWVSFVVLPEAPAPAIAPASVRKGL